MKKITIKEVIRLLFSKLDYFFEVVLITGKGIPQDSGQIANAISARCGR